MAGVTGGPTERWLGRRTHYPTGEDLAALTARKKAQGLTISVCLPARNEAPTVGRICTTLREDLQAPGAIDQIVVMDSRSTDDTAAVAAAAGAEVYPVTEVVPELPGFDGGKGEALWKSLAVARGDIVVWADADTKDFPTSFVTHLVAPLLNDPSLVLTKGFYERPLVGADNMVGEGGARVTELAARPLLNLLYPELNGLIQPLSGEYAVRTEAARSVPFLTGYASEIGLLIWFSEIFGVDSIAQVDLGRRVHRNQELSALGRMAHQVAQGALIAAEEFGRIKLAEGPSTTLVQFLSSAEGYEVDSHELPVVQLPRMDTLIANDGSG